MRLRSLLLLLAWMALLTYWSNQPALPIDQPTLANWFHNLQHRVAHLFAYGLLGLLAYAAVPRGTPRVFLLAVAIAPAFGAIDEFHQSFIPADAPPSTIGSSIPHSPLWPSGYSNGCARHASKQPYGWRARCQSAPPS